MTDSGRAVTCAMCGTAAPEPGPAPLDWMFEHDERRGPVWYCPACAREHVRAIESRLSQEWW